MTSGVCGDDIMNLISCSVKPAVFLHMGESRPESVSGVCVVDLVLPFGKPVNVELISFKNYYTACVTVRVMRTAGLESPSWRTIVRDMKLMEDPHTEGGAQDYCCIHRDQMQVQPDQVTSVRLILKQPSSVWSSFSLHDIKMVPHLEPNPEQEVSDWLSDLTLDDQDPDLEGLPDPQTVSSSIQQMWALTEVMQTNQTTASIGRFDVDGRYDIDLLSLT